MFNRWSSIFFFLFLCLCAVSARADITTGLLAYWRMDDTGASMLDSSGHGITGTVVNNPGSVAGKRGLARSFNGTSQYVNAGDIASLDGLSAFTLAAWIKGQVGAGSPDGVITAGSFFLTVGTSVGTGFFHGGSGAVAFSGNATMPVNDNAWHHVVSVYDGNNLRVYVDGAQDGADFNAGSFSTDAGHLFEVAACTGDSQCDGSGEMWNGIIDDVRVYNRALTVADIKELYSGGILRNGVIRNAHVNP